MYFDSHAHLTSDSLFPQIEELLKRATEQKVHHILNICTDLSTLKRGLEVHQKYPQVLNAGATTPHDVEKEGELYFEHFEKSAKNNKLVAVGETGLDYYYEHSPKKLQQDFFKRYIELAQETRLPLIIHCRDAFEDFFKIIDACGFEKGKGVLHCFTGTLEEAHELIKRDWYISFSGIVTFKKSEELRKVAKIVPKDRYLIETDSPYLAPQKHRGKQNEPSYVPLVAQTLAQVREETLNQMALESKQNAMRLFQL